MTQETTLEALADHLLATRAGGRRIVALAGPPGSGKSTAAERLRTLLEEREPGIADILPMDGFHFDDAVLDARGDRPRKGAPHTFDLDGFRFTVERLRRDDGRDVAVPVFDRSIEIARAGGRIIGAGTRIVVAEGNYLLLDAPGWRDLAPLFDATAMLVASPAVLEERLRERWRGFGLAGEAMRMKLEGNDLPNMRLVIAESRPADFSLRSDSA